MRIAAVMNRHQGRLPQALFLPRPAFGRDAGSRLREILWLVAGGALAYEGGKSLITNPQLARLIFLAPFLVAAFVVRPERVFIGWLFVAPLFAGAAGGSAHGHLFFKYLFVAPPLLMAARMAIGDIRVRRLSLVDALPALYLADIVTSAKLFPTPFTSPENTTTKSIYMSVGVGIVAYYVVAFGKASDRFPERVAGAFVWGGVAAAAFGLVDGLTAWNPWHQLVADTSARRAVGTFESPFALGSYLAASVCFAVAILVLGGPRSLRLPSVLLCVLASPALYFTYTRGPALGLLVAAGLIAFASKRVRWPSVVVLAAAGVVLLAFWGNVTSSSIYKDRLSVSTVAPRVVMTHVALGLFRHRPVFGVGYQTFDQVKFSRPLAPSQVATVADTTSHDSFLTVLAELGAVGLALLVLPWLVIAGRALAAGVHRQVEPWIVGACVGVLIAYAIGAVTYDVRFFSVILALPWITSALARRVTGERDAPA